MNHPRRLSFLGKWLANLSLLQLILIFVLIVLSLSLFFSILYFASDTYSPRRSFFFWYQQTLLVLSTAGTTEVDISSDPSLHAAIHIGANFTGLLLPALYVGIIVYRLVTPNTAFIFRNKVSIFHHDEKNDVMAVRFYNGTRRDILNVQYQVFVRYENGETGINKAIINKKLDIVGKGVWALSTDRVPFTIFVKADALGASPESGNLLSDGNKVPIQRIKELIVVLRGNLRDTSSEVYDSKTYKFPDEVEFQQFQGVEVAYGSEPRKWKGWEKFDA